MHGLDDEYFELHSGPKTLSHFAPQRNTPLHLLHPHPHISRVFLAQKIFAHEKVSYFLGKIHFSITFLKDPVQISPQTPFHRLSNIILFQNRYLR